ELHRIFRGDGTPAGSFDGAAGVLAAPHGDVYVADFYNHRVVRFGPDGGFRTVIGVPGRGLSGRLHYPTDLEWVDERLVVADAYNNRIQLFSPEGEPLSRFGGPLGLGLPGSGPGWFRIATGLGTDAFGHIYVADFENHRVQVFDAEGELLSVFGSRGDGPGEFERPTDLDIGPDGRIFVVDFGNERIQVFEALFPPER
ncbi:MAG: NHL repeat-containing protein, partial [Proteobacteria bacterium]|nr:NHL repeat-containing protein [Pseudomonadota bacterium]